MSLDDISIDDLLGEPSDAIGPKGVNPSSPLYAKLGSANIDDIEAASYLGGLFNGVSVTWLMQAFRMDRITVRKKLADLQPIKYGRGNTPIYDFVQAASCLVKPKIDPQQFLKSLKAEDLPPALQKEVWDAKLKRQQFEVRAGDLWRTDKVYEVFSETFKNIRSSIQLWAETVEREKGVTNEQRKVLTALSDQLLSEIYKSLVAQSEASQTKSQLEEVAEIDDVI